MKLAQQIDHLVLTVRDVEVTCRFYAEMLGVEVIEFGDSRKALTFGGLKINLHQFGKEFQPHAKYPSLGSADICFITNLPMGKVVEHFIENRIKIIDGPAERTGSNGPILSVYIKDPDGNLIEIANQLSTLNPDQNHAA